MFKYDKFKKWLASDFATLEEEKEFFEEYRDLISEKSFTDHERVPNSKNYIGQINEQQNSYGKHTFKKLLIVTETKCALEDSKVAESSESIEEDNFLKESFSHPVE